jgi:hypothetical protein
MKNLFCIDLRLFNHITINKVTDKYGIPFEKLWELKKDGVAKIWIDETPYDGKNILIAYNTKKSDEIIFTDTLKEHLSKMDFMKPEKRKLDTDSILEKISKFGISSLKADEKEFLDNLSK